MTGRSHPGTLAVVLNSRIHSGENAVHRLRHRRRGRIVVLALLLVAVVCGSEKASAQSSTPTPGQTFRESDQASLIDGALQLSQGQPRKGADFYNYDKQYLSYWLARPPGAAALIGKNAPTDPAGVVALADRLLRWGNLVSGSVALGGFWLLWIAWLRKPSRPGLIAAVVFFLSPVVLISAAPASSATISAGFLLTLIAAASLRGKWRLRLFPLVAPLLTFAAVAARADAVLCLPLICWASFRGRSWRGFRGRRTFWAMLIAAGIALLLGRWLVAEATTNFYGAFFEPKVLLAYLVFGLGGCGLWWLLAVLAIATASRQRMHWMGAIFLAVPMLFYGWQLFSPRHLMTTALVALAAGFLWKGRAIYRLWRARHPRLLRGAVIAVLAASLLPLVVGLYLPFPQSPRPVFVDATEFPTADGRWPMGATLSFLSRMNHADKSPIDHNQAMWKAALLADFSGCGETVPLSIMESDMRAYLLLAARLHGREAEVVSWQSMLAGEVPCAFVDERSLRVRSSPIIHGGDAKTGAKFFADSNLGMELVSPPNAAEVIVRVTPEGVIEPAIAERLAVAVEFGGDEFVAGGGQMSSSIWRPGRRDGGKSVVFSSREPFRVSGRVATLREGGRWWTVRFSGAEVWEIWEEVAGELLIEGDPEAAENVRLWIAVLPDYMSRRRL